MEVIVADNASTDGSLELLTCDYPEVRRLALESNYGFTGACNAAIRVAQGAIVVLLNNDTEAAPDWLAEIQTVFQRYPDAGMVASKILLFDRRDTFHTAGDMFCTDGVPANRGVWNHDNGQYKEGYVFSACGGAAAYRRGMLQQVGLLDESFFFSFEDVDLAWRAQLQGWRAVYAPRAVVYHHLSATGGGETASFHDGRNAIYVLVKDVPTSVWQRHWRAIFGRQLRLAWQALRSWRGRAARARLRGQIAGLWALPHLLRARRAVQSTRSVSAEYLSSILTSV
jgi:GT2 family glycosyltransferase